MEDFRHIQDPLIKIMDSDPGSIGTVRYYMVMSESGNFPEGITNLNKLICKFPNSENQEFEDTFFILHSTNTSLGEQIRPLSSTDQFTSNIVVFDECNEHHCLAVHQSLDSLSLISGSYLACFNNALINTYQGLLEHDDFCDPLNSCRVDQNLFWHSYGLAIEAWFSNVKVR